MFCAAAIAGHLAEARKLIPQQEADLRQRMEERLSEMGERLDAQRLEEEV
mgnify:CR=1 FL=1